MKSHHKRFKPSKPLSLSTLLKGSVSGPPNMSLFFIWVLATLRFLVADGSASSWCQQHHQHFLAQSSRQFEQKTDRFWEFKEQTKTWVEVELPYDLVSCLDDNCTVVGSIEGTGTSSNNSKQEQSPDSDDVPGKKEEERSEKKDKENCDHKLLEVLPQRKRISLTRMSEMSIWVTGASGSIYERFWNGVQWVIAPHDLPLSPAHAISLFIVNHTILALSESGNLFQMQISESSHPLWVEFTPTLSQNEGDQSSVILIKSGLVSYDAERVYFCTKKGTLLELSEIEPPRWINHGQPPGANVAAVADAASIRTDVIYTISSAGDLYEYDRSSKPSWKKHIWREGKANYNASLIPLTGNTLHGVTGDHSISLFLLTKDGKLVERRLHQRKWKWVVYGSPKDQRLTSITPVLQDDTNERLFSLFFTTSTGSVFEYQISKQSGIAQAQENQILEAWVSHMHPLHAKVARGIAGLQIHVGRILFPLDDGRLAELHLSGLGGENSGPSHQVMLRRKATVKYVWSILDAPETEGWNAEYCSEQRGPTNCVTGIKDEPNDLGIGRTMTRRRKGSQAQQHYLTPGASGSGTIKFSEDNSFPYNWINTNFHLRAMHGGRSFFLITDGGFTFEYLYTESVWIWLRHEHSTAINGALGNYNGSLYVVDTYGSLLIRERSSNDLAWINCTALRKGRQVIGGPPWDGVPGRTMKVTAEDALFFVSRTGRLLQFTVALRKFKWKDCRNPPNTKIASIVDQEHFRENIVFVVGRNGRLYQYNKVTDLWHEHYQSQHLTLSRLPGTAMRPSSLSLTGSLFMLSADGGLVEYHWNTFEGWNWVEHGSPHRVVTLVGSPGPSFEGNQLFLIGSNGNVYLRYMEEMTWRWKNCGFPFLGKLIVEDRRQEEGNDKKEYFCTDVDFAASSKTDYERDNDLSSDCNPEVSNKMHYSLRCYSAKLLRTIGFIQCRWPTFALPFWNWDSPAGMPLPAIYADPKSPLYDKLRSANHQPPTLVDLDYNGTEDNVSKETTINANLKIMYRQMVSNSKNAKLFFGNPYRAGDEPDPGGGSIEGTPHAPVHLWTGDNTQPNFEDMGNFYSAGRDPIFFAHHSNVDRMWSIWKTLGGKRTDLTDSDWLDSGFLFYNENAELVRVKVRDCLETKNLGYVYQDVDIPWLSSKPTPRRAKVALSKVAKKLGVAHAAVASSSKVVAGTEFPISLGSKISTVVKRPKQKKRSKKAKEDEEEILVIEGIEFDRDVAVKFDVYVNDVDDLPSGPDKTEFAGSFVSVPHSHKHKKKMNTILRLGLTDLLEEIEAEDDDSVVVTLVPKFGAVKIGGIKIEFAS